LFYYTAIIENDEDQISARPDVVIGVVGYQWNWQFNYVNENLSVSGQPGVVPELWLPIDRTVRFVLNSTDVQHSFWVPAFLFKRDVVPGRNNQFEITITKPGDYRGRCAEFCGVDHDRMLFSVHAVDGATYDKYIAEQEAARGAVYAKPTPLQSGSAS
ncbi:MAG: cytochrome c oxidase subunit, partial [Frankiaceae bacterium]|nr:cytochrome c oxidase subunit [Frankiaceae bacterium]